MPRLIIGHTSDSTARIWVRGSDEHPTAFLSVADRHGTVYNGTQHLEARHFHTGVFEVPALSAATEYRCEVLFGRHLNTPASELQAFPDNQGRFRTAPSPEEGGLGLDFLLGSSNLHTLGAISRPGPAYRRLAALAEAKDCDFMIHCGDQIYADVPLPNPPTVESYRQSYLDAWDDSEPTRTFLTRLPHYMILDDHEITGNFHNDLEPCDGCLEALKIASLKAYREFQHVKNPQTWGPAPLYYTFSYGAIHFFVLDVRTERYADPPDSQMMDELQMERLKGWLEEHAEDVKFIVTSVPFIAEIRNDKNDKWSSAPYLGQKHEVLDFLLEKEIERVVFLTGDLHCSYHAHLDVSRGSGKALRIHELMSSPINQIDKSSRGRFLMDRRHRFTKPHRLDYRARFAESDDGRESFYTGHSNVMTISVTGAEEGGARVGWEVYRTKKNRGPELKGSFVV